MPETNTKDTENGDQYEDMFHDDDKYENMPQTHSFELERDDISFERLLGRGNFGEVYKAFMGNNTVAVKSLKGK